jgi:hypothetical protein
MFLKLQQEHQMTSFVGLNWRLCKVYHLKGRELQITLPRDIKDWVSE